MKKIGITGQSGFIGTHLYNYLGLFKDEFERIPFRDEYFADDKILREFVSSCDVIVHLAALNRHHDPETIYQTNTGLVRQLITAMEATETRPHVLFSSSTQEEKDNPYGRSKHEGREMLATWARQNDATFTGLIIPNVFGPFGNPYYNSVIATFSHQLTHGEAPKIDVDGRIKLIYVGELVEVIIERIKDKSKKIKVNSYHVPHSAIIRVSELLKLLQEIKTNYFEKGEIPDLTDPFRRNLFNTFLCYIDHKSFFPFKLKLNTDQRGSFVETVKLNSGGQVSFSTTVPGITRGNHFHTRKAERFAVIKGKARIELRKIGTDKIMSFELEGEQPAFVDMPIWHTHNITNIGDEELFTIFWSNEFFDPDDSDTFFEEV